jgi:hypothetical protein
MSTSAGNIWEKLTQLKDLVRNHRQSAYDAGKIIAELLEHMDYDFIARKIGENETWIRRRQVYYKLIETFRKFKPTLFASSLPPLSIVDFIPVAGVKAIVARGTEMGFDFESSSLKVSRLIK